ncbi:MAG: YdcH family protein [bacterium]
MAVVDRLEALNERHRKLEIILSEEMARPSADTIILSDIKRQKLALKDEMRSLENLVENP